MTKNLLAILPKSEGLPSEKTFFFFQYLVLSVKNKDSSFDCQKSIVFLSQENRFYFYWGNLVEFDRCLLNGEKLKSILLGEFI